MFGSKKKRDAKITEKVNLNKNDYTEPEYAEKIDLEKGEKKESQESIKTDGQLPYTVELWDVWGSTSKKAVRFGAKRFIDKGNVFLVNEKRGFIEPFPEDTADYKQYKLDEINKEIKKKETQISAIKQSKNPQYSEKDLRQDIKILSGFKRSLELDGKGSYMLIDSDQAGARPLFMFDRRGNFRLPVFKNVDVSLLYIPTEAKITEASDLIRENEIKNGKNSLNLATAGLFILLVILVFGAMYFAYKTASLDGQFVEVLSDISINQAAITENFADFIETLTNTTNPVVDESVTPNLNVVND